MERRPINQMSTAGLAKPPEPHGGSQEPFLQLSSVQVGSQTQDMAPACHRTEKILNLITPEMKRLRFLALLQCQSKASPRDCICSRHVLVIVNGNMVVQIREHSDKARDCFFVDCLVLGRSSKSSSPCSRISRQVVAAAFQPICAKTFGPHSTVLSQPPVVPQPSSEHLAQSPRNQASKPQEPAHPRTVQCPQSVRKRGAQEKRGPPSSCRPMPHENVASCRILQGS
ncbi:uncharacterized protein J3D65DRAFT_78821 [Phyllosticta citribraziliensis]|uniref:Uncharacterized protein n=1 Tax=Phyllosticta citribraziliensis TaxID=989973 RepID=A0ABR1LDK9_9PEZI